MPSVRTRRKFKLGAHLARLRVRAKLEQSEVADRLRKSMATVSKIENGHVQPDFPTMSIMLSLYDADEDDRQIAEDLWEEARQDSKKVEHASGMPPKFRAFLRAEMDAAHERTLQQTVMPGLLQTPAYAKAVDKGWQRFIRSDLDAERAISSRLKRQERLRGEDLLTLHAVVDEAVVRRLIGGRVVMAGQLRRLLEVMELPNVTVQVLPFDTGGYGAMTGAVTILNFPTDEDPDVVYLEYPRGGEWIEDGHDVAKFAGVFEDNTALALPVEESAALIRAQLKALEGR